MRKLILAAVSVAALALAGPASAQSPIVIKFSHVVASNTPKGAAAEKFKELAEKYTDCKVKVEIYPNSTLYKDKEELEALQLGAVQMLAPSTAKFGPLGVKEFDALALPYLFNGYDQVHHVLQGPIGEGLLKKLEPHGMTGLAFWDSGFKQFFGNRVMRSPADLKGMKIRIQSSKVLEAQFQAVGALPQVLAFSEVYQALQTGVVDGEENPPSNIYSQKMHEVQKYLTISNHGYVGYAVIVNKKFWDGLPPDIRPILEGAMKDATRYTNAIAQQENDSALEKIRAFGKTEIYTLTDAERAEWRAAMQPVYAEMAPRVGKDLIDSIRKEAEAVGYK